MWEFTFGAELCWEEWQDLVGIISDLPRKHFVRSVPIPIPTRPSALGMSDPVMEFLEFHEKGKIFWERGGRF